ncbi:MAG: hypothetical protein Q8Q35_04270 [Nanoarchaeota archaeon]|nr:hypothetical protein [Nanoarchaeota archaeon]
MRKLVTALGLVYSLKSRAQEPKNIGQALDKLDEAYDTFLDLKPILEQEIYLLEMEDKYCTEREDSLAKDAYPKTKEPVETNAGGYLEVLVGDEIKLDSKVFVSTGKFGFFNKTRLLDNMSTTTINYGLNIGLRPYVGAVVSTELVKPELGVSFGHFFGPISTQGIIEINYGERLGFLLDVNLGVDRKLKGKLSGVLNAELAGSLDVEGNWVTIQRARLGLELYKTELGVGTDLQESNEGVSVNPGIYLKQNF